MVRHPTISLHDWRFTMARRTRKPPPKDWRAIIAGRIEDAGYTLTRLEAETGISRSNVSRFVNGERDIRLASAEKICSALDLVLVPREMVRDGPA
jgi:hypothetical protein